MKKSKTSLALALVTLVTAAGSFAQTTTTPTRPEGTPAGSAATGTTNSGGVAPATGRPETTPTGPTAGGTGSGTTPPAPPTMADRPGMTGTTTGSTGTATGSTATTTGRPETPGRSAPHTVNENASDNAKAVQAVLRQFDAKRDAMAAERKALIEKLNAATTEAERKAILEQLRTEKQAQADEQRALGKEIREELRKVRDQRKTGGG